MVRPQTESWLSGVKIPLMKTMGNLTSVPIILVVAGRLVGGTENRLARAEKHKPARITAMPKITGVEIDIPINRATITRIVEIATPYTKEARMSPSIITSKRTGEDIKRSSVRA